MSATPTSIQSSSPTTKNVSPAILQKTRLLLRSLQQQLATPAGKAINMAVTEVKLSVSLKDIPKLMSATGAPSKGVYVVITAVMIQKATAAASIASDSELVACADAIASVGGDLTMAALLAPETMGIGSAIMLIGAAVDSYKLGKACFSVDGRTAHALRAKQ
jgi:hypothetical protein